MFRHAIRCRESLQTGNYAHSAGFSTDQIAAFPSTRSRALTAADGITKSLSGQTDVWFELAVPAGFALVTMALGMWRLPWCED